MTTDPGRVVRVADYSKSTIEAIADHLDVSDHLDHLVYREAELDALYSLLEMDVRAAEEAGTPEPELNRLRVLLAAAADAHDLAAEDEIRAASERLRGVLTAPELTDEQGDNG